MARDPKELQRQVQRIDGLIQSFETTADPVVRAQAQELVQLLLELHGAGIERILDLVSEAGEAGQATIDAIAQDELAGSLLLLHDLHPLDLEERIALALDKARPYLNSHGGDVELLQVAGNVVWLRLQGSCHGCPSSAMTLKQTIDEAVYALAPEITAIQVEGLVEEPALLPPSGFVPLDQILIETGAAAR